VYSTAAEGSLGYHLVDARGIGDVDSARMDAAAAVARPCDRLDLLYQPIAGEHLAALAGEGAGDGSSDASGGAGHHAGLVVEADLHNEVDRTAAARPPQRSWGGVREADGGVMRA